VSFRPPSVAVAAEAAWLVGARTGRATSSISSNPVQTGSDTVVPTPAPVWVAVNIEGPQTVAPGEAVKLRVTVTNVSGEPAQGLRLEVRNAAEGGLVGQAAYKLPAIAPGAEATVEVAGVIVARPGERLQTRLVVTGGNLESEAVGSFTPLVRQDVADSWEPGPGAGLS